MDLTPLENWEEKQIHKVVERDGYALDLTLDDQLSILRSAYTIQGNFTIASLIRPTSDLEEFRIAQGVTKRHPGEDPFIPKRGKKIALARAVRNGMDETISFPRLDVYEEEVLP